MAYPRFVDDDTLVVDAHNGPETWTGARWNEVMDQAEHTHASVSFRLLEIRHATQPACLYTRGGQPTHADLAAVRKFGNYLRARYDASPDKAERLARSRQAIAAKGLIATGAPAAPEWDALTEHEREMSVLTARNWLIAAHLAGLVDVNDQRDAERHEVDLYGVAAAAADGPATS